MQPYFLPYIGYFQLIDAVDEFIIYDNIKYTKQGWVNRNRLLSNGHDVLFTVPLKNASDFLDIRDREISEAFDKTKLLNQIAGAYAKAPQFGRVFPLIKEIILFPELNLFKYILSSIERVCAALRITTKLTISSDVGIDHKGLQAQGKVIALCKARQTTEYINPIGGVELYDKAAFEAQGITLLFHKTSDISYRQFDHPFVTHLSILDVMMFNSSEQLRSLLASYTLS